MGFSSFGPFLLLKIIIIMIMNGLLFQVSEESLDELLIARRDPAVWEEGLEPQYTRFLNLEPTRHIASILSIL